MTMHYPIIAEQSSSSSAGPAKSIYIVGGRRKPLLSFCFSRQFCWLLRFRQKDFLSPKAKRRLHFAMEAQRTLKQTHDTRERTTNGCGRMLSKNKTKKARGSIVRFWEADRVEASFQKGPRSNKVTSHVKFQGTCT